MKTVMKCLGGALLVLALAACSSGGTDDQNSRTLSGQFAGGTTTQSVQQAAVRVQAAVQSESFQAALAAQGFQPQAGLWAPEVTTELWSQGDKVVASRADGGAGVSATLSDSGSFTLTLQLNVVYSLQLVRNGNFIAYLSNPDGTPINIKITSAGASVDLGSISVQDGKFVVSNDPAGSTGVSDEGEPADYDEVLADYQTIETTLIPAGIVANDLYDGAVFLALDANDAMVGMGIAPEGQLVLGVPSETVAATVTNFATFDEFFLGDISDLPANTPTFPIQVPYFEEGQDFSTTFPPTINDGAWALVSATVVDDAGDPIADALLGAVSVSVGTGDSAPTVMVVNVGRTDANGNVQFYLLSNLDNADPAESRYTYSLVASHDLSANFMPLYDSLGNAAVVTPAIGLGSGDENQYAITLSESNKFLSTWEMEPNNPVLMADLTVLADGTYVWGSDTGIWDLIDGSVYLDADGWGYSWRLDYVEDSSGDYLDVYMKPVDTWSHWGYGYPK